MKSYHQYALTPTREGAMNKALAARAVMRAELERRSYRTSEQIADALGIDALSVETIIALARTLHLSVTLNAALSATTAPFATGVLVSHDGANLVSSTADHYWPFIVTTSAIAQQFGLGLAAPPRFLGQAHRPPSISAIATALHARSL